MERGNVSYCTMRSGTLNRPTPREKGIYPAKQGEYHLRMKSWQCECRKVLSPLCGVNTDADGGGGDKTYVRPSPATSHYSI